MNSFDPRQVDRREICRYLGTGSGTAGGAVAALIEDVIDELAGIVRPAYVFRTFPVTVHYHVPEAAHAGNSSVTDGAAQPENSSVTDGDIPLVDLGCFSVRSRSLAANLRGCGEVIMFAATLGEGADFLARKYGKINMSRAAVCQAAAAAMTESYCDMLNEEWREEYRARGCALRPRFSCGYGDFSIDHQRDILLVLEMDKRLGIRLNDAMLMYPTKSVTALIGIADI